MRKQNKGQFSWEVLSCATLPFGSETRPEPWPHLAEVYKLTPLLQKHLGMVLSQMLAPTLQAGML